MAHCYGARAAWAQGRIDESRELLAAGLALAERLGSAHTLCAAYAWAAVDGAFRREPGEALDLAERVIRFGREHAIRLRVGEGLLIRGWARAWIGDFEASRVDFRQGLDDFASANTALGLGLYRGWRAEALGLAGELAGAIEGIADALRAPDEVARSDALRIRGDIFARCAANPEKGTGSASPSDWAPAAEASYRDAIVVAQAQAAASFELRAAIGLARMLNEQERRPEAREALAPFCGVFSDALISADLKEARSLLAGLDALET
jgi:hypothetical protein